MEASGTIKAVLFDIGGVLHLSPLQAISDFEVKHGLPVGWINFTIKHGSPNGPWQRLERGELQANQEFFQQFQQLIQDREAWHKFVGEQGKHAKLKDKANPTQLGDPVSLKAESSAARGSQIDRRPGDRQRDQPTLSKLAKDTTIGDPVSLESEDVVEQAPSTGAERSQSFEGSEGSLTRQQMQDVPGIDAQDLFWSMMSTGREPDPYIFPAVQRLSREAKRPMLGTLSNSVQFPAEHPWNRSSRNWSGKDLFDIHVASSDEGTRKPSRKIYEIAVARLNAVDRDRGGVGDIRPSEIIFLDDIGENLKAAQHFGMQTIKVQQGKTWRAVKELEKRLHLDLVDEKTRRSKL